MIRSLLIILITIVLSACTTPRPAQQADKVRSGEETAKTAADAAREAEAKNNTGLIVASSESDAASTQPTTQPSEGPAKQPAHLDHGPTLRVKFVKGALTQAGEPIVNFAQVCADAVATAPDTVLIIDADPDTEHAKVMEAVDAAKAAGIRRFSLHVTDESKKLDDASGAQLMIEAEPAGIVVIDGKETGQTTPATIAVETGKHELQVKFPSGLSKAKTLDVREGSRIKLFFREDKDMPKKQPKKDGAKDDK